MTTTELLRHDHYFDDGGVPANVLRHFDHRVHTKAWALEPGWKFVSRRFKQTQRVPIRFHDNHDLSTYGRFAEDGDYHHDLIEDPLIFDYDSVEQQNPTSERNISEEILEDRLPPPPVPPPRSRLPRAPNNNNSNKQKRSFSSMMNIHKFSSLPRSAKLKSWLQISDSPPNSNSDSNASSSSESPPTLTSVLKKPGSIRGQKGVKRVAFQDQDGSSNSDDITSSL